MLLRYKLFISIILFMTCIGAVSASSIEDNSIYLDTANLANDDMLEISTDTIAYEPNMENALGMNIVDGFSNTSSGASNMENALGMDVDGYGLSENESSGNVTVTTDSGGIRNISLSDGYNGYCIDMNLHGSEPGDSFTVTDTAVILNHVYNTSVGQYLKILFYNYYDELSTDKDKTSELIWTFTDRYYLDSTDELVLNVLSDYDGGLRVPDHGAVKKLNDTHEMTFDFEKLISSQETIQNYFAYTVSIREIANSNDTNASDDNGGTENGTNNDTNTSDNETDNDTNSTDDVTGNDTNSTGNEDATSDLNENSESSDSNSTVRAGNEDVSSLDQNAAVSSIVTGNPLFMLILALVFLAFIPFKKE